MGQFHGFEWDDNKDRQNRAKHHLSLIAAATVFEDPIFIDFESLQASHGEPAGSQLVLCGIVC
jgi:uncharacterized DUF497 family protein